jgi:hypothetical protein
MKNLIHFRIATLALIGVTLISCKEEPKQNTKTPITTEEGTSIMIKSTMQKKEWEDFKKTLDSTINTYDIKIAELKIKMQDSKKTADSATTMKIKMLEEKNLAIKSKLNAFMNQTKRDRNAFKSEINHDLNDFDNTINRITSEKK